MWLWKIQSLLKKLGLHWENLVKTKKNEEGDVSTSGEDLNALPVDTGSAKRVTFQAERTERRRLRLWEFLVEDPEDGFFLSIIHLALAMKAQQLVEGGYCCRN